FEMFYLADEMFKQTNKEITITFGKPISYTYFDKSLYPKDWAKKVKDYIYKLAEGYTEAFQ
ncbi:MAG: hypothetical protein KAQ75_16035, partial [Bacteroidales bacterium]|nr:hypothetical protein [Bacteroidales bacterium]